MSAKRLRPYWRTSVEDEVESELAFHLEMTTRDLMQRGMSEQHARMEAERRFGSTDSVNADCRRYAEQRDANQRKAEYRHELGQDVTFAIRQLIKAPAFAAVAILTLALGIGATAAVFSVLNAVVLRPLPFDHADRITMVFPTATEGPHSPGAPDFLAMRNVKEFSHVAATILQSGVTMKIGESAEMMGGARVTYDYFNVFGMKPEIGRTFTADEDAPGHNNVAVISHRLWLSHFNGERSVIGRTVWLDGNMATIIGVMPATFDYSTDTDDLWIPLALRPEQATEYTKHYFQMFARLAPGVTIPQAQAAATAAERTLAERFPERTDPIKSYGAEVHRFSDQLIGDYYSLLFILLGAVSFVLLIACTNVANLLLARGSVRTKELAIRAALGAGRGRLVRQLLTESLVLAITGSLLGLGLAYVLLQLVLALSPSDIPRLDTANIDWRVLAFTFGVGLLSAMIFGLLPAVRTAGPQLQGALREGGRGSRSGRDRLRGVLVTAEVALAIALLVASGVLIRSAWLIEHVDPGFDPRAVLTARLVLPASRYPDGAAINQLYERVREDAARIPGVKSTALTLLQPLSGSNLNASVSLESTEPGKEISSNMRLVSDGYFATMGIPLIAGRDISRQDVAASPPVVVINEALAQKLWPTLTPRDVLGHRINSMTASRKEPHYMTVVGVVANLHDAGLDKPPASEFYAAATQTPEMIWPIVQRSLLVVLRASNRDANPELFVKPLRAVISRIDSSLPIAEAKSMESFRRASLQMARMNTILLATLGGIALVLAMVGIYGVVSYFVSQRTHEIGVRMALGASPGRVWQFVIRRGLAPIVAGVVAGFALSLATTSVLREQLYRVSPHDPLTMIAVGGTLVAVALVAMYLPARRAMRVAPIVALNDA